MLIWMEYQRIFASENDREYCIHLRSQIARRDRDLQSGCDCKSSRSCEGETRRDFYPRLIFPHNFQSDGGFSIVYSAVKGSTSKFSRDSIKQVSLPAGRTGSLRYDARRRILHRATSNLFVLVGRTFEGGYQGSVR